jgi:hypothetical protein
MIRQQLPAPQVLGFPDRQSDGAYPVQVPDGSVVASIKVAFWRNRFDAFGAGGERICSGRAPTLGRTWLAQDAQGRELVAIKTNWGRFAAVTLRLGEVEARFNGSWRSRDWQLSDTAGRILLSSTPQSSAWSFHPDTWLVHCDQSLSLAEAVAIVQLNRLRIKGQRDVAVPTI